MQPFSLLIKPASADCNLRCPYCFYAGTHPAPGGAKRRMSPEVLDRVVSSYMATDQPIYTFGWQGGEPTLMGAEFFREVTRLQAHYGGGGSVVSNGLQTNGTLIDDGLARHLGDYEFLVGVSLDGPAEVHDFYRRDAGGQGTHAAALQGVERLKARKVKHNSLTLVTNANVARATEVYNYLADDLEIYHQQYIPCVEFGEREEPLPWAISAGQWGDFLCELFDLWNDDEIEVRPFDSIFEKVIGEQPSLCHLGTDCRHYFVVEYNGDVYPCDFFVTPERRLGNILEDSWEELLQSEAYREFGGCKAQWNERCAACEYLEYCAGDCLKHRFQGGQDPRALSWLCEGWRQFYAHGLPAMQELADLAVLPPAEYRPSLPDYSFVVAPPPPVGRNDPCPCGSGKKYKRCCGG